jgi:hypothetical protein
VDLLKSKSCGMEKMKRDTREVLGSYLSWDTAMLSDKFRGFSSFDHTGTSIIPRLGHDLFLLNPFQFLINHSDVCGLDTDSFVK